MSEIETITVREIREAFAHATSDNTINTDPTGEPIDIESLETTRKAGVSSVAFICDGCLAFGFRIDSTIPFECDCGNDTYRELDDDTVLVNTDEGIRVLEQNDGV